MSLGPQGSGFRPDLLTVSNIIIIIIVIIIIIIISSSSSIIIPLLNAKEQTVSQDFLTNPQENLSKYLD